MAILRLEKEIFKMSLDSFAVLERMNVLKNRIKQNTKIRVSQKDTGANIKSFQWSKLKQNRYGSI